MEVGELIKTTEETIMKDGIKIHIIREYYYDPESVQRGYELLRDATVRNIINKMKEKEC